MRHVPSNQDNIIDSRDIIARIRELESSRDDNLAQVAENQERIQALEDKAEHTLDEAEELNRLKQALWDAVDGTVYTASLDWDEESADELTKLLALQEQCEGYSDWRHGETLIAKSHFVEYAQQLADDIGAIPNGASWPMNHIDWDAAAEALSEDYTEVDFDGVPFYIRNC